MLSTPETAHPAGHPPLVPRLLTRLEELGLVDRAPDPADRRSSLISATGAGRALLREQRSRKEEFLAQRLAALDPDELQTLERAAGILERVLDGEGRP